MSKYLLVGDIHLSDRPPSSCTDTYLEDLFVILEHTVRLESELGVDGVVWSGDVFHHKQPSRTSHKTVQRAIDIVQRYKNLWIVPGNHDMLHDRLESVAATQPLGVLFQAGAKLLNGWCSDWQHPIYGVPWLQTWDEESVTAALGPWQSDPECPWAVAAEQNRCLVIAHAPLYPPGSELVYEYYPTRDEQSAIAEEDWWTKPRLGWSSLMANRGSCYYGHVHEAHGTYIVDGVTYCNQGAVTRGSLHESDLARSIAVTTWSPEEGFVRVDVPHKPADEVFRLMAVREVQDQQAALDEFLASIGEAHIEVTSVEAVLAQVRGMDLGDEIVRLVEELLEEAARVH